MTQEEKRIKIAEAREWSPIEGEHKSHFGHITGIMPDGTLGMIPDYFGCLNACHEMEESIEDLLWETYAGHLAQFHLPLQSFKFLHATAAQRAEAFGLTLGLWTS